MRRHLFISLLLTLPAGVYAQSDDSLVAHYPFSGNAEDASGNSRGGIVLGAELGLDRFENPNSAYSFGEEAAIYLGASLSEITLPFTVATWLYHNGPVGRIDNVMSSNEAGSAYTGFWLQVHSSGQVELSYGDGGGRSVSSRRTKMSGTRIDMDRWTHVAGVVRSETDMSLYIDGQDAGGTYSGFGGAFVNASVPGFIGLGDEAVRLNTWDGMIDELRVYDRDLSDDEVQTLFALESSTAVNSEPGGDTGTVSAAIVYPNPLRQSGFVRIVLDRQQHLHAELLDVVGRRVLVLHDGWAGQGETLFSIEAGGLVPGTYLLRVQGDDEVHTQQIVIR